MIKSKILIGKVSQMAKEIGTKAVKCRKEIRLFII